MVDEDEFMASVGTKEELDRYDGNGDGVLDGDELEGRAADKLERPNANVKGTRNGSSAYQV